MSRKIYTSDIYDFQQLPNPLEVGDQPFSRYDGINRHEHPEVGTLEYRNLSFPFMHLSDMKWTAPKAVQMHYDMPLDAVSFVFNMAGKQTLHYNSIGETFNIEAGNHYMVHVPDGGFRNELKGAGSVDVFHLSLDKSYLTQMLGTEDAWTDQIGQQLEQNKSFIGGSQLLTVTPAMRLLIDKLRKADQAGTVSNLYYQAMSLELVALQIEQYQRLFQPLSAQIKQGDVGKLKGLKEYLEAHYLEDLNLAQLGRTCFLNEFKLKKGFRELFGTTVFGYIRKLRMDHAARMLRDGETISAVAYHLGYEYPNHFSVAFKAHTGENPGEYQSKFI